MKKVTILIPCYNEAKTIEEVVSRVVNSDVSDKEIIIIDDCSNDGTKVFLFTNFYIKLFQERPIIKGRPKSRNMLRFFSIA